MKTIVWFRQDLRLADNPALFEATKLGLVIPLYIWNAIEEGDWQLGQGSQAWLKHSLEALNHSLEGHLIVKTGLTLNVLQRLIRDSKAENLFFNRRYEPTSLKRDQHIITTLEKFGVHVQTFNASLLVEPWEVCTKENKPYRVFTPFWKTATKNEPNLPLSKPHIQFFKPKTQPVKIDQLGLKKKPMNVWEIGEKGAQKRLRTFMNKGLEWYGTLRDRPDRNGVSRISPYLHFGEISPRQIWYSVKQTGKGDEFLRQLYWREFAYHILYHFPQTVASPLREEFKRFPWQEDQNALEKWQQGNTGYPIIDAGMRQLQVMGWMHNRVRMIVASFLTKDLLISWQEGAKWFWEYLVDADLANNTLGWQWAAGCGADAAPYFRIFNPTTQSERFDPDGHYIRCFIPELKHLSNQWIHRPWDAPKKIYHYPSPIIDHRYARERALKSFETVKKVKK